MPRSVCAISRVGRIELGRRRGARPGRYIGTFLGESHSQ